MIDINKKLFRWGPLDAAVLPLGFTIEASFEPMYNLFGICWPESLIIFDHDKALWILESENVASTSDSFTEKIMIDNHGDEKFYSLWQDRVERLASIQQKIAGINISDLNMEELANLYAVWSQSYIDFWAIGMTAELINYSLEARLKTLIKTKLSDERDVNEAFALLSTPDKLSFYKEEEIDLMQIVLCCSDQERDEKLREHQQKYFWIYNNYLESNVLSKGFFQDQIKHLLKKDAEEFLKEFSDYSQKVRQQKQNLVDKLHFLPEETNIIRLLNDSVIFQDDRKKYNLMAAHFLEIFLEKLGSRASLSSRDLKWLLPQEIESAMQDEDVKKIIEQRKHLTVISRILDHSKIEIQNSASRTERLFNSAEFEKSVNLQGTVASTSHNRYFRGPARIILSPKEGHKLKAGEILVTTMTTPDFVVFMKKAGAIITDVGGVTCHAAVVSREFGLPCIVGTENATKLIKDGDILELHNLRGTVKIIPS